MNQIMQMILCSQKAKILSKTAVVLCCVLLRCVCECERVCVIKIRPNNVYIPGGQE